MPDYPESAIRHCAEVMYRQYESEYSAEHLTWRDFTGDACAILDAAAADLGEFVAGKITAHMEAHGPRPGTRIGGKTADDAARRTWRRHLGIAARVAAGAFLTEEDEKRLAAEAIARGDYVVCDIPEVPGG